LRSLSSCVAHSTKSRCRVKSGSNEGTSLESARSGQSLPPGHNPRGSCAFAEPDTHRKSRHGGRDFEVGLVVTSSSRWPPLKVGAHESGHRTIRRHWCRNPLWLSRAGCFVEEGAWQAEGSRFDPETKGREDPDCQDRRGGDLHSCQMRSGGARQEPEGPHSINSFLSAHAPSSQGSLRQDLI
jgi:hypothetical protein